MTAKPSRKGEGARVRRGHQKSRLGCGNCKLRRVKCGEEKPACQKCKDGQLSCTYGSQSTAMTHVYEQAYEMKIFDTVCSAKTSSLDMMNTTLQDSYRRYSDIHEALPLTLKDLEVIERFQVRTLPDFGVSYLIRAFRLDVLGLSCKHPFLLHIILTLTAMHDRDFLHKGQSERTAFESYHSMSASRLFNHALSEHVYESDPVAVWMTAGFINAVGLFAVEDTDVTETWPMRPEGAADLQWLRLQRGLQSVWRIVSVRMANEVHPCRLKEEQGPGCVGEPPAHPGINGIAPFLAYACKLDEHSNATNNPYYTSAGILSVLLPRDLQGPAAMRYLIFLNTLEPQFEALLRVKDPVALLLLALWYAKARDAPFWLSKRAIVECRAICAYLDQECANDMVVQDSLAFPKAACGYYDHCPAANKATAAWDSLDADPLQIRSTAVVLR